jgi:Putative Actinobacterial Holin-X, holin superfamily III
VADSTRREVPGQASTAELIGRLTDDVRTLVRDEIRLAQFEMKQKGKQARAGAGLLGGAGIVALLGVATLIACAVLALGLVLPHWAAALIVGIVVLAIAGVLALLGRRQIAEAMPPVPGDTIDSVKKDVDTVRGGATK